jgi:hypothetical protein
MTQPNPSENPAIFSEIDLDATGFTHTLHILEGIAAEGKDWADRVPYANSDPEANTPKDRQTITPDAAMASTVRTRCASGDTNREPLRPVR